MAENKELAGKTTYFYEYRGHRTQLVPKKQDLSEQDLGKQNIRGYAAFVQVLLGIPGPSLLGEGNDTDPLTAIGVDASKVRELVEGVELALYKSNPREQQAIRAYFSLDKSGEGRETLESVGRKMKDISGQKPITGARVDQLLKDGIRKARRPGNSSILVEKLWGKGPTPPFPGLSSRRVFLAESSNPLW